MSDPARSFVTPWAMVAPPMLMWAGVFAMLVCACVGAITVAQTRR